MSTAAEIERVVAAPARSKRSGRLRRTTAVVLAGFCAFLGLYAPQPLLPLLAREFRSSVAAVSLVIGISTIAVALAAPFIGLLADRLGRKQVIVPATLALAVPTLLAATAGTLNQLLFWRFWQGLLTPGIFAVTVAYISDEWQDGVGAAMAGYVTGTVLGGYCGRTVAAIVASRFGWQPAFAVLGTLIAAAGVAIWAWLPAGRRFKPGKRNSSLFAQMALHLKNPRLIATYAVGFCVLFSLLGTFTYVNFYLAAAPFHLGTGTLGLIFTTYLVGAVITPFAGRAIDRFGNRVTLAVAFAGAVAGSALTLIPSIPAVIAGLSLSCTGVFIAQSAASSYIGKVTSEGRAAAVGLYVSFYYAGGSAGAAIPGHLWAWGGWTACISLIAAVQILTIAIALLFWKPVPKAAPAQPLSV